MSLFGFSWNNNTMTGEQQIHEFTRLRQQLKIGDLIKFLDSQKIDLSQSVWVDENGSNILHYVIRSPDIKTRDVVSLIDRGVDINQKDIFGQTPIDIAIRENKGDLVKALYNRDMTTNINENNQIKQLLEDEKHDHGMTKKGLQDEKYDHMMTKQKLTTEKNNNAMTNRNLDMETSNHIITKHNLATEKSSHHQTRIQLESAQTQFEKKLQMLEYENKNAGMKRSWSERDEVVDCSNCKVLESANQKLKTDNQSLQKTNKNLTQMAKKRKTK